MSRALVLLLAHPDDESFLAAGTIAKCVEAGIRVGLLCATRGERGKTSDLCTVEELAQVREAELREASRILGIHELELLPYQDQQLVQAPVDEIRRSVVRIIRRMRPQVVLTFDPEGSNQHTDHIAISRFAMDGIAAAADGRWYPGEGQAWQVDRVLWPAMIRVWELEHMKDRAMCPGVDFLIDISEYQERKEAALKAHRTQWHGLSKLFLSKPGGLLWEAFRVGAGPRPAQVPAANLFG
jgi:LmbE family N-acetylglucosaminyl deacetylase